jgi:hypothetical protein
MAEQVVTVTEVLDGHTSLDIQCLDRIYLNAYVPKLQTSAQVVAFLSGHLGYPFPSPALFRKLGEGFRKAVGDFAADNGIPWVRFGKHDGRQAGADAPVSGPAGGDRLLGGGRDRGGAGVPTSLDRL